MFAFIVLIAALHIIVIPRPLQCPPKLAYPMVSITGLDKVELLKSLWDNSKPAIFFDTHHMKAPMFGDCDVSSDEAILWHIDYYSGRAIKMDLSGDEVDATTYDRYSGTKGRVEAIVNSMCDA